jgi:hypothetical protein
MTRSVSFKARLNDVIDDLETMVDEDCSPGDENAADLIQARDIVASVLGRQ